MYVPADYVSSEESEDDFDFYVKQSANKNAPEILTEKQKEEQVLRTLFNYVQAGNMENTMEIINDHNFPIDVQLEQDWTPLLLSASYGHYELTKCLIEKGADVDHIKDMKSVLMHACNISKYNSNYSTVVNIVKLLVEHKCDINFMNNKRMTAYLFAASTGNVDVIKYLQDHCNTDVQDNQGWNALFYAVNDNHIELVEYLLSIGMDPKKKDVRQNTPLFYARQNGFLKIEQLIPDDSKNEPDYASYMCENYDYKAEIANPKFMKDVTIMLYQMNCGAMLAKFQNDPTMNLCKFLSLTRNDLIAMGITKPYQLNRILGALYQFHVRPFKFRSIPHIEKMSVLSTYDVGFTMFTALRHYITMQATLKYLRSNNISWDDSVLKDIESMEKQTIIAKNLISKLQKRCSQWDKENARVDLISYRNKQKTRKLVYFVPVITAITIVLYFKFHL